MNDDVVRLLRSGQPLASMHVDVSHSTLRTASDAEHVRRDVMGSLTALGADEEAGAALVECIAQIPGSIDPVGIAALAAEGIVVSQATPGDAPVRPRVEVGRVPDLSALLRARERAVPMLLVEAKAAGGEIFRIVAPGLPASPAAEISGEAVEVEEAHAGGIAERAHAGSAADALEQNARKLADRVGRLVRATRPDAVLVTGDPRTAAALVEAMPDLDRVVVATLGKDTIAAGAAQTDLHARVSAFVDDRLDRAHALVVDELSADGFRLGAVGVQEVVDALRTAAVSSILIGPQGVPGQLLALTDAPWIAREGEVDPDGEVLDRVAAGPAIMRAALLTGAEVLFTGDGELPRNVSIAARLRHAVAR